MPHRQPTTPWLGEGAPYVVTPDYDHAMVCDTRYDDLRKCEEALKALCGKRGFLDLRIRPCASPVAMWTALRTACCSCSASLAPPSNSRLPWTAKANLPVGFLWAKYASEAYYTSAGSYVYCMRSQRLNCRWLIP